MAKVAKIALDGSITIVDEVLPIIDDVVIPLSVTARQFKMQLFILGIKDLVEQYVEAQGELVKIAYDNSTDFFVSDQMIRDGLSALGFTQGQKDEFWSGASKL